MAKLAFASRPFDEDFVHHPLVWIVLIIFGATLIRSTLGFGAALTAVPLLALLMPVREAVPLAVLVSVTISVVIIAQDHRHIHTASAVRLAVATLPGVPLGLLLLTLVAPGPVKVVLAAVIIGVALHGLLRPRAAGAEAAEESHRDPLLWVVGLVAGILGGAYGMNGPPMVIYATLRGWSPTAFRATLQACMLPASLLGLAGYWFWGLWTPAVTWEYMWCLPAVFVAILLGRALNRRLPVGTFIRLVHVGLMALGIVLLVQAL